MLKRTATIALTLLVLSGCTAQTTGTAVVEAPPYPIPNEVVTIADPNQDLTTARLDPADGCYWYSHSGPVETTLVPLRATNGNHICNARTS